MIFTIVACGQSSNGWIPRGTTIAVNDALRYGADTDYLILVNAPRKFTKERLDIIRKSKAHVLTNSPKEWGKIFPNCEKITRMISFNSRILKGFVYSSATSPIIAISTAIRMGGTEIILYGVDMLNHRTYSQGTKKGLREIGVYQRFFQDCKRINVKVYLGALGTAFDEMLPLYIAPVVLEMQSADNWVIT